MSELPLRQIIEGAILAADGPISIDHMMLLFEHDEPSRAEIRDVLTEIDKDCADRGFELKKVASGYRFQVRTEVGEWVSRLWEERAPRYSRALLETLALIAYRQPITRGDIEEVRGVAVSTNIIRTMLEREWIRVVGHRDVPGRPAIYATTKNFLDYFNLNGLDELPTLAEIKDMDKVNEELDLVFDEAMIEPRVLELEEDADAVPDPVSDDDLDKVTAQVDAISDNIRNLFKGPDEETDLDDDQDDGQDDELASESNIEGGEAVSNDEKLVEPDEANPEMDEHQETSVTQTPEVETPAADAASSETRPSRDDPQFANVPPEILNAAFADEDDNDDDNDDKP